MRRYFVLCLLFLMCCMLKAQNREIAFEHTTLKNVLLQAAKAGKPVFVDCYTEYCGPCKNMAATVFKTDSVADFFNKTFINLKMDMLSTDGKKYADIYKVGAYPTFLILDNNGKEIYKFVGGQSATKFMAQIRMGINPKNRLRTMNQIYASGKYDDAFMQEYIKTKIKLFEIDDAKKLSIQYIKKMPTARRSLLYNWFLYSDRYLTGAKTFNSNYLLEHWSDFIQPMSGYVVYKQIGDLYPNITESVLRGWYFENNKYDAADFDYYSQRIKAIENIPNKQDYITMMDVCKAACLKDSATVCQLINERLPNFDAENQQILFGAIGTYFPYENTLLHNLAIKIVRSGKKSNLYNYLVSLLKPEEAYEGEKYDVPNLKMKIGSTNAVPFFHPTKNILWYTLEDKDNKQHYYTYNIEKGKAEIYNTHVIDSIANTMFLQDQQAPIINYSPEFDNNGLVAKLSIKDSTFVYDDATHSLKPYSHKQLSIPAYGLSPDSKYKITEENFNLWQEDMATHKRKQLTFDGEKDAEYVVADMEWLSKNLYYIVRNDSRNVRTFTVPYSNLNNSQSTKKGSYPLPCRQKAVTLKC